MLEWKVLNVHYVYSIYWIGRPIKHGSRHFHRTDIMLSSQDMKQIMIFGNGVSNMAATATVVNFEDGSISEILLHIPMYLCAKFHASIPKGTILLIFSTYLLH